jgi:chemotaxis signal transduction protein
MAPKTQSTQSQQARYLLVTAGGKRCALPVAAVQRILRSLVVHPVPGSSTHLLGLAQYGGEPLAVLDLETLLDAAGEASGSSGQPLTVVVRSGNDELAETIGLAVDDAVEVIALGDNDLKPSGPGVVRAEAVVGGELVSVMDLDALAGEG